MTGPLAGNGFQFQKREIFFTQNQINASGFNMNRVTKRCYVSTAVEL